jgi:hypothetical protein
MSPRQGRRFRTHRAIGANEAVAITHEQTDWPAETLEQRVQRLEDAVASLQDSGPLEERITQRVADRLQGRAAPATGLADKVSATRPAPPPPTGKPFLSAPSVGPQVARQTWLIFDVLAELRAMVRMFFDVRYHVGWSTRLTVLVLVPLLFLWHWWVPLTGVWLFGPLLEKSVDLVLAFFIYKALSREAQRYREAQSARAS